MKRLRFIIAAEADLKVMKEVLEKMNLKYSVTGWASLREFEMDNLDVADKLCMILYEADDEDEKRIIKVTGGTKLR